MKRISPFIAPLAGALLCAAAIPAFAGTRAISHGSELTACSRYSNGCYTATLAQGRQGRQLVLHNGTRIDCARDCKNSLREATVDFWDTMRENGG